MKLNKKIFVFFLFLILIIHNSFGQNCPDFYQFIQEGDQLFEKENPEYYEALLKYQAAAIAAKECNISVVGSDRKIRILVRELDEVRMEAEEVWRVKEEMVRELNLMRVQSFEKYFAEAELLKEAREYKEALQIYCLASEFTLDTLWIQNKIEYCKHIISVSEQYDATMANIEMKLGNANIRRCDYYERYDDILDEFTNVLYFDVNTETILTEVEKTNTVFRKEIYELENILTLSLKDKRKNGRLLRLMDCTYFKSKMKEKNEKIINRKVAYKILLLMELLRIGEGLIEETKLEFGNK